MPQNLPQYKPELWRGGGGGSQRPPHLYHSIFKASEVQSPYLLVLIGRDGGEDGLSERKGLDPISSWDALHRRQLLPALLPDHMDPGLVLVHGMEYYLEEHSLVKIIKSENTS